MGSDNCFLSCHLRFLFPNVFGTCFSSSGALLNLLDGQWFADPYCVIGTLLILTLVLFRFPFPSSFSLICLIVIMILCLFLFSAFCSSHSVSDCVSDSASKYDCSSDGFFLFLILNRELSLLCTFKIARLHQTSGLERTTCEARLWRCCSQGQV